MTITAGTFNNPVEATQRANPYLTVTSADTTATIDDGLVIDNQDGAVKAIFAQYNATSGTGSTNTLKLALYESNDNSNFYASVDSAGNAIATSAANISSASATVPVVRFIDTTQEGRENFAPFIKVYGIQGGSAGMACTVAVSVVRRTSAYPS